MITQDRVWDLLVDLAGASEGDREDFVHHFPCPEYRFQGVFGFGGKLYYEPYKISPFHVGYYKEDRTECRDALERLINRKLLEIWVDSGRPTPVE